MTDHSTDVGVGLAVAGVWLALFCVPARAADWPTRLHDVRRGGVSQERLTGPLTSTWTHAGRRAPSPAWTESPARHDYLHDWFDMKPRQGFDRCFDVAVVGDRVYFGSSASGAVTCLDLTSGKKEWRFFADGPVRFAPQVAHGNVYFGSDDGVAYCLRADDGALVWKQRAGPGDEMIWGNQRMISVWPVRSSLLVDGEDVFWTAGIFPEEGMFLCKRNALDGAGGWTVPAKLPPQGYLLATPSLLFVPTGKTYPQVYRRSDGAHVGSVKASARDGGCWALLTPDDRHLWSGPAFKNQTSQLDANTKAGIATVGGANYVIADGDFAYYNTDSALCKIRREGRSVVWRVDHGYPFALVKAADTVFAGGDGEIAAFSDADGRRIWTAPVKGKAYGLAVANGRLLASTDRGSIHCFATPLP
ncbi:MAG: PQQ-binding-like beta-propeller repeat protein [Phycisphaerae bacterium]|nr:PQQ-binding-like beta-propeller repeat protein [Phycisphaerae bacterium]